MENEVVQKNESKQESFVWLKKHSDTIAVLAVLIGALFTINSRLNQIEKDITMIKTVLILKNVMPSDMCKSDINKKPE